MKTTVEISEALLHEARRQAQAEGTSLRELIEEGLRAVVAQREQRMGFVLPDASVDGEGLQEGVRGASWEEIRALTYGDRL